VRLGLPSFLALLTFALGGAACQRSDKGAATAPADCARVADTLASFELGPAAKPDARAAAVATHKAACESAKVTHAEASCLYAAKDTWAARACLPRIFPLKPQQVDGTCATVAARMREATTKDVGSAAAAVVARLDQLLPALQSACEQDKWPASVVNCVAAGAPGDSAAFSNCMLQLAPDLQQRLTARFQAAMQPK